MAKECSQIDSSDFFMNCHTIACILVNYVGIDFMPLLSSHVPSTVMPVITYQLTYCAKVVHTTNLPSVSSDICGHPRALAWEILLQISLRWVDNLGDPCPLLNIIFEPESHPPRLIIFLCVTLLLHLGSVVLGIWLVVNFTRAPSRASRSGGRCENIGTFP